MRLGEAPDPRGKQQVSVRSVAATDRSIGAGQYGVVFNHSMQAYGALTGEIVFRVADAANPADLALRAGLAEFQPLGEAGLHVARADSAQSLIDSLRWLRSQPSVVQADWVVVYGLPKASLDAARQVHR